MADKLTHDQIAEFKTAFALFDRDGRGAVSAADLGRIFTSMGLAVSQDELAKMIADVDQDGKGQIDFPEFLTLMSRNAGSRELEEEIKEAFRIFDKQGRGYITGAELRHVMTNMGHSLTDGEINEMVREADPKGDGTISYQEFLALLTSK